MKRLLLALGLSLIAHAIFFRTEANWLKRSAIQKIRPEPIALTLHYYHLPQRTASQPPKRHEVIKKISIPTKKKQKESRPKPKPQKKTKKAFRTRKIKPPRKIEPAPQPIQPKPHEPEETPQSKVTSEPAPLPAAESPPEQQGPERGGESLDFSSALPSLPPLREAIPAYKKNPHPEYPRIARRRGYEGTVVLDVLVSQEGRVDDLRLFRSSGHQVLDRAAMAAVKKWLFEPGTRGEEKVEMWVKVPIRFQLK